MVQRVTIKKITTKYAEISNNLFSVAATHILMVCSTLNLGVTVIMASNGINGSALTPSNPAQ